MCSKFRGGPEVPGRAGLQSRKDPAEQGSTQEREGGRGANYQEAGTGTGRSPTTAESKTKQPGSWAPSPPNHLFEPLCRNEGLASASREGLSVLWEGAEGGGAVPRRPFTFRLSGLTRVLLPTIMPSGGRGTAEEKGPVPRQGPGSSPSCTTTPHGA